ncbi:MAG: 50S ribosomal protein L19 [Alphaproteobacteria bacterium]|nr:MAG: 50S ribosomal protein L19 [Alphaproteobacteria bacterium]
MQILELFNKRQKESAKHLNPDGFRVGDMVAVEKLDSKNTRPFTGLCIRKTAKTALIRRTNGDYAVEYIFPLYFKFKFEKLESYKVRRAKLYYLRNLKGKSAKLKRRSSKSYVRSDV